MRSLCCMYVLNPWTYREAMLTMLVEPLVEAMGCSRGTMKGDTATDSCKERGKGGQMCMRGEVCVRGWLDVTGWPLNP